MLSSALQSSSGIISPGAKMPLVTVVVIRGAERAEACVSRLRSAYERKSSDAWVCDFYRSIL